MSNSSKINTLIQLLLRGEWRAVRVRWRYFSRSRALASAKTAFVFLHGRDRLVCDPHLPDSASAFLEPSGDVWEKRIFHEWLRPRDVVIDAGANIGLFTSMAADCVGELGRVITIEPTPRLVDHLRLSAHLLGHTSVEVHGVALGGTPGRAQFAFAAPNETAVSQSLASLELPPGTAELREVEVVTLASLTSTMPALIKLDVEGVEVRALGGAPPGWLTADGPLWVVECHPLALARFGATMQDIFNLFPKLHFDRWLIGKYAGPFGADLPPVPLDESSLPPASFHNLIAVPKGSRWEERRRTLRSLVARS